MTPIEIYVIAAPLVLVIAAGAVTYWWLHRPYPEDTRGKHR